MTDFAAAVSALLLVGCGTLPRPLLPSPEQDDSAAFPEADAPAPLAPAVVPEGTESDWVQLSSGEWLRGALDRIRGDAVEFDSEVLGDVSLDLGDIRSLRTKAPQAIVTDEEKILHGTLVLEGDELWVVGGRTVKLDRGDLLASMALRDGRSVDWSGALTVGATARSGNTQQNDQSTYAELQRETAQTVWRSTYSGVLSRASGTETANNHRLRSVYSIYLSRRLFMTAPSVDLYRDRFQNIDHRLIASTGIGYRVLEGGRHVLTVSGGPAYQATRFRTAAGGEDESDGTLAATVVAHYGWDVTSHVDFGLDYTITAPLPETEEYNHNLVARIAVNLINDLTLDVVFVWDRVNEPVAQAGGVAPFEDDFRTTVGLGWSF